MANELLTAMQSRIVDQKMKHPMSVKALYSSKPEFIAKYSGNEKVGFTDQQLADFWDLSRSTKVSATASETHEQPTKVEQVAESKAELVEEKPETAKLEAPKKGKRQLSEKEVELTAANRLIVEDQTMKVEEKVIQLFMSRAMSMADIARVLNLSYRAVFQEIKWKQAARTGNMAWKERWMNYKPKSKREDIADLQTA